MSSFAHSAAVCQSEESRTRKRASWYIVRCWHNNKTNYDAAQLKRDSQLSNAMQKISHCAFRHDVDEQCALFWYITGNFATTTTADVSTSKSFNSGNAGTDQALWEKVDLPLDLFVTPMTILISFILWLNSPLVRVKPPAPQPGCQGRVLRTYLEKVCSWSLKPV